MKKARTWIVLIFVVWALATLYSFVFAGDNPSKSFYGLQDELSPTKPPNKHERLNFAKSLLKRIEVMYNAVPDLSPSQEKWLQSEMSSKNAYRSLKAMTTDEYHLQSTKKRLKNILTLLTTIIEGKYQGRRVEVAAWLSIAATMMEYSFSCDVEEVATRGLAHFPDGLFVARRDVLLLTFDAVGQSILGAVVGPYLMGWLPE